MYDSPTTTPLLRSLRATHSPSLQPGSSWYLSLCKQVKNKSSFTRLTHHQPSPYKLTPISSTPLIPTPLTRNLNYQRISFLRNLIHRMTKTSTFNHQLSRLPTEYWNITTSRLGKTPLCDETTTASGPY